MKKRFDSEGFQASIYLSIEIERTPESNLRKLQELLSL